MGTRIGDMRIGERAVEPGRTYKVASWASVAEGVRDEGRPVWDLLRPVFAREEGREAAKLNVPRLIGVKGNRGLLKFRPSAPILPDQFAGYNPTACIRRLHADLRISLLFLRVPEGILQKLSDPILTQCPKCGKQRSPRC